MRVKFNWGTGIVAVFVLFFLGLAVIVTIAMNQRNDLVRDDYYAQELKHEEQLNRERRTAALHAPIRIARTGAMVTVTFPAAIEGRAVTGQLQFYRPADERKDLLLPLAVDSTNTQYVPAAVLSRGLWRVKVRWAYRGEEYYSEESLVIE